jgi:ParB family chromosome partitioning protein
MEENVLKLSATGRRNALGRGLSALMAVTSPAAAMTVNIKENEEQTAEVIQAVKSGDLLFLPLTNITPNPNQPRKEFNEYELKELSESIKESGLLQPLVVRKISTGFEIVAGERRFRAAKMAGLTEVPAILKDLSDKETLAIGIVENVQRADLNPIDEALAYQRLIEDFEETQNSVAQLVGKDRVTVANALRLIKLPNAVKEFVKAGKISAGHARALLGLSDPKEQQQVAQKIVSEGLSVRAVEKLVLDYKRGPNEVSAKVLKDRIKKTLTGETLERLQGELSERFRRSLSTKVNVKLISAERGEVTISFFSKDELESLLERFES